MDSTSQTDNLLDVSRPRWGRVLAWVGVLLVLGLVGAMLFRRQQGQTKIGQEAPTFSMVAFDGQNYDIAALRGKVVLINFWASWCIPCEEEAADLEAAWQSYQGRDDVIFLGIAWTDTDSNAKEYLERFNITYPNGPDLGTRISQKYRITGVPETFILNRDGKLSSFRFSAYTSPAEIRAAINAALGE